MKISIDLLSFHHRRITPKGSET